MLRLPLTSVLLILLGAAGIIVSPVAEAAGPWRGRVIDSETRESVQGVAVLVTWNRRVQGHPALGSTQTGHIGSEETITDANGEFSIPERFFFTLGLGFRIDGPELAFFKVGYGGWQFVGPADAMTGEGALIEMKPLRTSEEQIQYLDRRWTRAELEQFRKSSWRHADRPANPIGIPYREAKAYETAINAARAKLGLKPTSIGFPYLWTDLYQPTPPETAGEAKPKNPSGLATDAQGNVYVADTDNHRILKYSRDLSVLTKWGTFGREDGQLQFPRSVAVDRDGTVYVADWGNHRVQMFTSEGRFLGKWGELRYDELGGSFTPTDIGITDGGEIIVFVNGRVHRFTSSGRLTSQWGVAFQFYAHTAFGVDGDGNVFGVNGNYALGEPVVLKFDSNGKALARWGERGKERGKINNPNEIAVDSRGRVYVLDGNYPNHRVVVFDADGVFLGEVPLTGTLSPHRFAIDDQGYIYVTDRQLHRLIRFDPFMPP